MRGPGQGNNLGFNGMERVGKCSQYELRRCWSQGKRRKRKRPREETSRILAWANSREHWDGKGCCGGGRGKTNDFVQQLIGHGGLETRRTYRQHVLLFA